MSQKSLHLSPKALKGEDSEGPWGGAPNASYQYFKAGRYTLYPACFLQTLTLFPQQNVPEPYSRCNNARDSLVKRLQFLCGFDAQTEREGKDRQNMPVIHVIHIASGVESAKAICSG